MTSSIHQRPVIFGEVLFDVFSAEQRVLGGAPFNVAWHLQGFGLKPLFISRIGQDDAGEMVLMSMRRWGMDTRGVQLDPRNRTGSVEVKVTNGQPSYEILADQAYDHISRPLSRELVRDQPASLLYAGTLALRHIGSAGALQGLLELGLPLFVDINLRAPWWSEQTVQSLLDKAKWVKLNDDELQLISKTNTKPASGDEITSLARHLLGLHSIEELVVTRGEQGACRVTTDSNDCVAAEPVENIVDTVGAGDALAAVYLLGIIKQWPAKQSLQRAVEFAAAVCRQQGAIQENMDLYQHYLNKWEA
jgi:fructokinase